MASNEPIILREYSCSACGDRLYLKSGETLPLEGRHQKVTEDGRCWHCGYWSLVRTWTPVPDSTEPSAEEAVNAKAD